MKVFIFLPTIFFVCHARAASPLVTGNGFGFATVSATHGHVMRFYAHPYRYEKPDPNDDLGEGLETANFFENLTWRGTGAVLGAAPVNESHVLSTGTTKGNVVTYMPFGLARNALITSWFPRERGGSAELQPTWAHPLKTVMTVHAHGFHAEVMTFDDVNEPLLVVPLDDAKSVGGREDSSRTWAFLVLDDPNAADAALEDLSTWRASLPAHEILKRELRDLESWRANPHVRFQSANERKLWRHSETLLRMAQSREPNRPDRRNHGLIVASVPEGLWFVAWVRDMAYATQAFIRMGHAEESRAAVLAFFNAGPVGLMRDQVRGFDYQISTVRYFGDGSEEPFFTMERDRNVEFDNWGLVLSTLADHVTRFNDRALLERRTARGRLYEVARDLIAKPLLGNLDDYGGGRIVAADTSIWENYPGEKAHFAYSTATAIQGLRGFMKLALLQGDKAFSEILRAELPRLEKGFLAAFASEGRLRGTLEYTHRNDVDGAVLEAINFGVVKDRNLALNTVNAMEFLRMRSGGYRRVRGDTPYEKQEFLFINFSLAEAWLRLGRADRAAQLIRPMVEKSMDDHGFIPEMYVSEINDQFPGDIGTPTGSIPMVGYGAGVLISYLIKRDQILP